MHMNTHKHPHTLKTPAMIKTWSRVRGSRLSPASRESRSSLTARAPAGRRKIPRVHEPSWYRKANMSWWGSREEVSDSVPIYIFSTDERRWLLMEPMMQLRSSRERLAALSLSARPLTMTAFGRASSVHTQPSGWPNRQPRDAPAWDSSFR